MCVCVFVCVIFSFPTCYHNKIYPEFLVEVI